MKLPVVSRKKFDDVYSELQVQKGENLVNVDLLEVKEKELSKIKDYYMDLMQEVVALKEDKSKLLYQVNDLMVDVKTFMEEKKDLEKQIDLMTEYNDISTNKNCELSTKLVAELAKNKKHEEKIQELEYCVEQYKYENRQMIGIIKRTNMVKTGLIDLVVEKDENGKLTIDEMSQIISVNTKDKVSAKKVYNFARLLG